MAKVTYAGRAVSSRHASSWEQECSEITREKSRRRTRQRWVHRVTILCAILLPVWVVLTGWHMWRTGVGEQLETSVRQWAGNQWQQSGLMLQEVQFNGLIHLQAQAVAHAAGLEEKRPLISYDLAQLRSRIEAMPQVRTARVRRVMPDALHITIEERQPAAVWQRADGDVWLDCDGTVLTSDVIKQPDERNLVALSGAAAGLAMPHICKVKQEHPALANVLAAAQMTGGRRLTLWLRKTDGSLLEVMLPEAKEAVAMARLTQWMDEHQLLSQPALRVDMRLADRVLIKLPKGEEDTNNPMLHVARAGSI